jgi:hypothetical protein
MSWPDLIIDRSVTDNELAVAIAKVLGIPRYAILVGNEMPEGALDEQIQLVCTTSRAGGEFRTAIALYPQSAYLIEGFSARKVIQVIEELCAALHSKCLISDDSPNPYGMVLIEGPGVARRVFLDADKLDQDVPEYFVKSS